MKLKDLFESSGKSVADLGIDYRGGDFICTNNELTSLVGSPEHVDGEFYCAHNQLTSLEGAPSYVNGGFDCYGNKLTTLVGGPERINGSFGCDDNYLTSLRGAPSHVPGTFSCADNELLSLNDAPTFVGASFDCPGNKLSNLKGIHMRIMEINGAFYAYGNPIKSHVLGLLLIKGIAEIQLDHRQVEEILNRHLDKGRAGMLQAQEELIEAGLEEFAQL